MLTDSFSSFDVPGSTFSSANGINASGQIVGLYGAAGGPKAYMLSGGVISDLVPFAGSTFTQALSISDAGQVVGSYRDGSNVPHGFLYDAGSFSNIDVPGALASDGPLSVSHGCDPPT